MVMQAHNVCAHDRGGVRLQCHTCRDSSKVGIVMREDAFPKLQQVDWQGDCLGRVPRGVEEDASSLLCCKLRMQGSGPLQLMLLIVLKVSS